jgi:hypothetical protein
MFPALRPILNKGGAGRYISREESVERLLPIAERHLDLLYTYSGVLDAMPDGATKTQIEAMMPYLRTEIAKMNETILSLNGAPPQGIDRRPVEVDADTPVTTLLDRLVEAERGFGPALVEEVDAVHHQERTRAILTHNAEASASRLGLLRELAVGPIRT